MFRRATPLERLPPEHVRECVTRLYRQSGLRSPAELTLVGIFERVPGGVVHAVSPQPSGVVLRLDHRGKAAAGDARGRQAAARRGAAHRGGRAARRRLTRYISPM